MTRLIDPDAEPVGHRPVYRRIDPRYPDRKMVCTRSDMVAKIGAGARLYDLSIMYRHDRDTDTWHLKEEFF